MQTLTNIPIIVNKQDAYDFYYGNPKDIADDIVKNNLSKNAPAFINQNKKFIENQLGLNELIYKLHQANENSNSAILEEKFNRADAFKNVCVDFVLRLIHTLYWIKFPANQSNIGLNRSYDIAISIGKNIVKDFETQLNSQYDIASIIEAEFGKRYGKK